MQESPLIYQTTYPLLIFSEKPNLDPIFSLSFKLNFKGQKLIFTSSQPPSTFCYQYIPKSLSHTLHLPLFLSLTLSSLFWVSLLPYFSSLFLSISLSPLLFHSISLPVQSFSVLFSQIPSFCLSLPPNLCFSLTHVDSVSHSFSPFY